MTLALVMSGGGARAAYQVGVLRAIATLLPEPTVNPFPIICGTSAGAINAASLASNIDRFDRAVSRLARTWGNLHVDQVFRADLPSTVRTVSRCLAALLMGRLHRVGPFSLLESAPLAALLARMIDFSRIRHTIAAGHLNALCVTASSYSTGDSVSFFQASEDIDPWRRARRVGRRTRIGLEHVLASCALPYAFPTVRINGEHFGDGSMQQLAPISSALHLGARRVLVIGVGSPARERGDADTSAWPSLAQIAGHLLDAIFVDTLDMDLERLHRVNHTLAAIPAEIQPRQTPLHEVETLVIRPHEPLDGIVEAHAGELPRALRFMLRRFGVLEPNGARVLSYLLFERGYCRHLMHMGFADAVAKRAELMTLLQHEPGARRGRARRHHPDLLASEW